MKFKVKKIHHRFDFVDMTTIYEQFDQYQSTYIFSKEVSQNAFIVN